MIIAALILGSLITAPAIQMSFAKKASGGTTTGDSGKGSGSGSSGSDSGGSTKKDIASSGGGTNECAGCPPKHTVTAVTTTGDPNNPDNHCPTAAECKAPGPNPHDDGCTDAGPNKCPTPLTPDPNGGGTYCPGDSSTRCFKDEKDYAGALWENGIRKASDCTAFDDQSECQQAVKDFHCTFFANCNSGGGRTTSTTVVSTITGGLTSVQSTNLSARIAQLQSLMSKPYGAECKSQIQTLLDVTQQALDAQNGFIADHLPTLQQGIPACYGLNAEQIMEVS